MRLISGRVTADLDRKRIWAGANREIPFSSKCAEGNGTTALPSALVVNSGMLSARHRLLYAP